MKKITILVLILVLSSLFQCRIQKPITKDKVKATPIVLNLLPSEPVAVKPDTPRVIIKYVEVPKVVFSNEGYSRIDSLINTRMSMYSDSNKTLIASQSMLLGDYKEALVSNIKLIDSLKRSKQEKKNLKIDNTRKQETINSISRVDYYVATAAWIFMVIMIILVLVKQHRMKREIILELRTGY